MNITKNDLKNLNLFEVAKKEGVAAFIIDGTVWRLYIVNGELKAGRYDELKTTEYNKLPKYIKNAINKYNAGKQASVELVEQEAKARKMKVELRVNKKGVYAKVFLNKFEFYNIYYNNGIYEAYYYFMQDGIFKNGRGYKSKDHKKILDYIGLGL